MAPQTERDEGGGHARPYRWCLPLLATMLVLLVPAASEACPYCAGQLEGRSSYGTATVLMLLTPPTLLGLLYLMVRDSLTAPHQPTSYPVTRP